MWRTLGITQDDWSKTPVSVQNRLVSLHHENYSLNLRHQAYQQLESAPRLSAQIQQLNRQVSKHQHQIGRLRAEIKTAQQQMFRLQKRLAAQANQLTIIDAEIAQIEALKAEAALLRERIGQNSRNSSLPPSSDSPFGEQQKDYKPSGLKRGAQPGHKGAGRRLLPVAEVDQIIELRPAGCRACQSLLLGVDANPARRQVTEIIAGQGFVTEYRQHRIRCLSCRTINRQSWPVEAVSGAFGANVKAITAYLTGRLSLSQRDTVEAFQSLFNLKIGLGSIAALQRQISILLAEPVAQAAEFVKQQSSQCVDETGWRENNLGKWLWVNSAQDVTVFQIRAGRSHQDAQKIINSDEFGVVTTDRYPGYNFLQAWRRQICWAHLKRDFIAISERADAHSKEIGNELLAKTKKMFELYHRVRDGTLKHCRLRVLIEPIKKSIREILESGTVVENTKTARTCQNILKQNRSLWTFVRFKEVEPTNNRAERALRRAVIWRKKSFGTQSEQGSRFVERILTVATTLRQQGRSVLDYLKKGARQAQPEKIQPS